MFPPAGEFNGDATQRLARAWEVAVAWRGDDEGQLANLVLERLKEIGEHPGLSHELDVGGLILAQACARGNVKAIAHFENEFVRAVRPAVSRVSADPGFVDEVLQRVRTRCLLNHNGPCALDRYAARGSLMTYVRVVAVREALMLRRSQHPQALPEELDVEASLTSPELGLLKRQFRTAFADCFRTALAGLDPEARNLLRHHYFHGLTFAQLGELYGQSRSAVGRRIEKARARLLSETRRGLAARLSTTKEEFEEPMALVASQIDLSLERHLAS